MNRGSVWGQIDEIGGESDLADERCRQRLALFSSLRARLAAAAHGCRDKSTTYELAARRGEDRRHFIGVWRPAMDCRVRRAQQGKIKQRDSENGSHGARTRN